jgi:hypothetical protein
MKRRTRTTAAPVVKWAPVQDDAEAAAVAVAQRRARLVRGEAVGIGVAAPHAYGCGACRACVR